MDRANGKFVLKTCEATTTGRKDGDWLRKLYNETSGLLLLFCFALVFVRLAAGAENLWPFFFVALIGISLIVVASISAYVRHKRGASK